MIFPILLDLIDIFVKLASDSCQLTLVSLLLFNLILILIFLWLILLFKFFDQILKDREHLLFIVDLFSDIIDGDLLHPIFEYLILIFIIVDLGLDFYLVIKEAASDNIYILRSEHACLLRCLFRLRLYKT